jgi:hypothetical protein
MARTIPAVIAQPPLVENAGARRIIHSGASGKPGNWRDEGRSSNLAMATGRAQPAFEQWWADGQFAVDDGAFTVRLTYRVIYCSAAHVTLQVGVFGESPTETGQVRFRSNTGADSVVLVLPALAEWVFGELTINAGAFNGTDVVYMDTEGECFVFGVAGYYQDLAPNGDYPGANDELAAVRVDGARPIDDIETADDEPLDSGLGFILKANLDAYKARRRIIFNCSGIEGTTHRGLALYPMRQAILLPHRDSLYHPIRLHVLCSHTTAGEPNYKVYIDRGDGGRDALFDAIADGPGHVVKAISVVANSGTSWKTLDLAMVRHPFHQLPPQYQGMAQIGVYTDAPDTVHTAVRSIMIEELD